MALDRVLESWRWNKRHGDQEFDTRKEGWVVTAKTGLYPQHEYSVHGFAGASGSYLGGGWAKGLAPSGTFVYGDQDPLETAKKVSDFISSLTVGGYPSQNDYLAIKPYGSSKLFSIRAVCSTFSVSYEHGGRLATVEASFQSEDYEWGEAGEIHDGQFGWNASFPW